MMMVKSISADAAEALLDLVLPFSPCERISALEKWVEKHRPSFSTRLLLEELQAAYDNFLCLYQVWFWLTNRNNASHERLMQNITVLLKSCDGVALEELEYTFLLMNEQRVIPIEENYRDALAERLLDRCEKELYRSESRESVGTACDAVCLYCSGSFIEPRAQKMRIDYIQAAV